MARRTGRPSYLSDKADVRHRRTTRFVAVAGAVALVTALLGGLVGYQVGRPDATEAAIATIQEAEAKRDAQQILELTGTARRVRDQIAPVLAAIKTETSAGRAPDPGQARQWQEIMRQAAEPFADPPSGTTATNVARGGLRGGDPAGVAGRRRVRAGRRRPGGAACGPAGRHGATGGPGGDDVVCRGDPARPGQRRRRARPSARVSRHRLPRGGAHAGRGARGNRRLSGALLLDVGFDCGRCCRGRPDGRSRSGSGRPDRVRSLIAKSMNQIGFLCKGSRIGGTQP